MGPKVSVCIPAYRQPTKLRRALRSVSFQTFKDFEVVVTDDSPDDSVERVTGEFREHINLLYYRNSTTMGSPKNWNEAVRLSSGGYIKILHHDDWFRDEDSLAEFVAMLDEDPEANFAFCSSVACDSEQNILFVHTPSNTKMRKLRSDPRILFYGNFIGSPSATIYRRNIKLEYDVQLKWLVDVDFYIRTLSNNKYFSYRAKPLVCIGISDDSVTAACAGNRSVELFEYLYLYRKISPGGRLGLRYYAMMWWIFMRYGVTSREDLIDLGMDSDALPVIDQIIFFQHILQKTGLLGLIATLSRARQHHC